jgi:predicted enzyme related to lactoylglutathione lyase
MPKAHYFSLYYDDAKRAASFYSKVLGWELSGGKDENFNIKAGPDEEQGLNGDLKKRVGNRTTIAHFGVKSVNDTIAKLKANGGKVISETTGFQAFCEDTEGNVISIFELKNFEKPPAGGPPPRR